MATKTLGTAASTSLTAVAFSKSLLPADVATIQQGIRNDKVNGRPIYPGAFSLAGLLYIPNRGILQVQDGDYVAFDPATGWPILVSATAAAANPQWIHS